MKHLTKSVASRDVLDDSGFFASVMSVERKGTTRKTPREFGMCCKLSTRALTHFSENYSRKQNDYFSC